MALELTAVARGDKKANVLRTEGLIPAEFYGPDMKNVSVALPYNAFAKVYNEAGNSSLVTLNLPDGKNSQVFIGALQVDPRTSRFTHIDLRQVSMTEKMEAAIELKFVGTAAGVNAGGVFVVNHATLAVKALPKDLVSEIEVDISALANIDDKLTIADIKLPAGVETIDPATTVIVTIGRQAVEAVVAPTTAEAEKAAVEAVASAKKEKKEEEPEEKKK
jgi:large subunit ribosomal protein L25